MKCTPIIDRRWWCLCAATLLALVLGTPEASAQERGPGVRAAKILEELANDLREAAPGDVAPASQGLGQGHGNGQGNPGHHDDVAFYETTDEKVALGKFLFWDKVLSGNQDISCATCHHSLAATGDGLSLPVGQSGVGLGVTRSAAAIDERVPRNAPHVFNLGATEFTRMFHDGRVELLPDGTFRSPAGDALPQEDLENVLAAQAMFPVTSVAEMAGEGTPIGDAAADGDVALVWELIAQRLRAIPEYVGLFEAAFPEIEDPGEISYAHAANAIAAYENVAFRADNSPYDRWLAGEKDAMSKSARKGLKVFENAGGCVDCHSGRFQTNHEFAAIAMPQIGPGKGDNQPDFGGGFDDFGRQRVTGAGEDMFRFRNLSLRNVELTGPWGHDGAYNTLEAVVRHHLDPVARCNDYDTSQAVLPENQSLPDDFTCHDDVARRSGITAANELAPRSLSDEQIAQLMDFLHALTDPASLDLRHTVPTRVPSGLPLYD